MTRWPALRDIVTSVLLAAAVVAAGCEDDSKRPPLTVVGGGFIFNYRAASAYYGVSVKLARAMPKGTVIEVQFEDPSGGPAVRVSETVTDERRGYALETPPLRGVVAGRDYLVVVHLKEAETGREIYRLEHRVHSELDQDVLPEKPLTVGPGYTPNPDSRYSKP
ncbi:MAG: hypothetical protein R3D27_04170 [Hyphomicrobiaceae bacterium]